ncbi:MAG TPA: hypothetical protein VIM14_13915, partial [Polyangia bacterium]
MSRRTGRRDASRKSGGVRVRDSAEIAAAPEETSAAAEPEPVASVSHEAATELLPAADVPRQAATEPLTAEVL